jgi:hypothetical protein
MTSLVEKHGVLTKNLAGKSRVHAALNSGAPKINQLSP